MPSGGNHVLGVGNVDESVLVGTVLEEIAVIRGLLGSLCVKSIDLGPVLGARAVLVDHAADGGLLALGGLHREHGNASEERRDGDNRSLL